MEFILLVLIYAILLRLAKQLFVPRLASTNTESKA